MSVSPAKNVQRLASLAILFLTTLSASAAPADRIVRAIDSRETTTLTGHMHRQAVASNDMGAADPGFVMDHMTLMFKPSAPQQAELDRLLTDQQNPSSPKYRAWLTPEEFGDRFGVSAGDQAKVAAWLRGEGFTVNETARGRNWVSFTGTAEQVTRTFRTEIHRFNVKGKTSFANTADPSIPSALADVAGAILGLNDFLPANNAIVAGLAPDPDISLGTTHYLAPEDYATIYDIAPLYHTGFDGSGQSIVIVGASAIPLADVQNFRIRFGLPANDPVLVPYGADLISQNLEGQLDVEWSGAIAPRATIYYVYGASPFTALTYAVNLNIAPVISSSWYTCETDASPLYYRSVMQQANAQGITVLSASGDGGAAGCFDAGAPATHGPLNQFPASLPEVTAVGGTMFTEGTGTYWATTNSTNGGSALSYIPEAAWNESVSGVSALGSGGGPSSVYSKPLWQNGPGVPNDNARDTPDISLTAAGHDAYWVVYGGQNYIVYGTSAAAPSMAGIMAILNQYQVSKGFQKKGGLGNINPQLYRLAQAAPAAFHDIVNGSNIVPCVQGSPGCLTGSFGFPAGPGYDMATGLGSVDANNFVTKWNTSAALPVVILSSNNSRPTVNDQVQLTATVIAPGSGTPTGEIEFSVGGTEVALGAANLAATGGVSSATITVPGWMIASGVTGTYTVFAQYSGDAAFTSAGASLRIPVSNATGVSAIVPSVSSAANFPNLDNLGWVWQEGITLREVAGVPSQLTGFTIDGKAQTLSQYFPSASIPAAGSISSITIYFRNITGPVTKVFGFTGTDATGQQWTRQISAVLLGIPTFTGGMNPTLAPLTMVQNTAADPSCQWSQQLFVDETAGGRASLTTLLLGGEDISAQIPAIFGTERLQAYASLSGTLCWSGYSPGQTDYLTVGLSNGVTATLQVSFAGPPAAPAQISATPASLSMSASGTSQTATASLSVSLSDKTQVWTASVLPSNRTTSWLKLSQLSGTGPGQISLTASAAGFEPGAYRALIVLQSPASLTTLTVPVMFVIGSGSIVSISSAGNSASFGKVGAPGMLFSVFGNALASGTTVISGSSLPFALNTVSAQVNGQAAPISYASPTQINLQIPYEVGSGPAVLAVNNNGQVAGYQFQIAAAAPAIYADSNGFVAGNATATRGASATLYLTGDGEIAPALNTGTSTASTTAPTNLPRSRLPFSVTVGGVSAFLQGYGIPAAMFGVTRVVLTVPSSVPAGVQPVVVTVGGVASAPVNMTVQ